MRQNPKRFQQKTAYIAAYIAVPGDGVIMAIVNNCRERYCLITYIMLNRARRSV